MRRRAAGILLVLALALPADALADDHRTPRYVLLTGEVRQRPHFLNDTWVKRSGDFCMLSHGDGAYGYPDPDPYVPGAPIRIRFIKDERPDKVAVFHHRLEVGNDAVDPYRRIRVQLRPVRRDRGIVAWDAIFTLDLVGDHYLDVSAMWRDRNGCGFHQSVSGTFHLRSPL